MTLRISELATTVFRLPLDGELAWGKSSSLSEVKHVLVQVTLSDGSVGYAEAPPRPTIYGETAESIVSICKNELAPRLIGESVEKVGDIYEIKNNHTAKGAVDIALHDALACSSGKSLIEHLGCTKDRVRVSYILGISDQETMLQEAQKVFEQGVRVLKVKVGRDWDADIKRLQALFDHFGDTIELYADANECFTEENTKSRLGELKEMGVLYCEEPVPVEKIVARKKICEGQHLPVIADDSAFTVRDLIREIQMNTFDILNIKTARTGYTESKKMLDLAVKNKKGVMLGSQASTALGTTRTGFFAALAGVDHPSELSFFLKAKEDIVTNLPQIKDGYLDVKSLLDVKVDPYRLREAS